MLMHASYDVNAISRKGALPIWIGGSLFMALFSPVSHSLYKFECGPVHPLTSQHLNTAASNRVPLAALVTEAVEEEPKEPNI